MSWPQERRLGIPEERLAWALLSGDFWDGLPELNVDRREGTLMRWPLLDDYWRETGKYLWYVWHQNNWYLVWTYKPETDEQWERTGDAT